MSRGLRVTGIVTMNSLLDVLTGTYITPTRRRALQDVNVEHSDLLAGVIISRAGGIRTHDLLNPIQAHYQAVLRPVVFELSTERIELAKQVFLPLITSEVEVVTQRNRAGPRFPSLGLTSGFHHGSLRLRFAPLRMTSGVRRCE